MFFETQRRVSRAFAVARDSRDLSAGGMARVIAAMLIVALVTNRGQAQAPAAPHESSVVPERSRLITHVGTLAGRDYGGRRGEGARKAGAYIIEQWRELGLEPLFGDSYEQPVPSERDGAIIGHNVGAVLRGGDPSLRDEWIIVSAHHDHLGMRNGVLHPGADDNASGVAMLLELARCLSQFGDDPAPRRSIAFVGFDLEENGLWGSRYFATHPPFPLDRLKLFITADMIGRSLAGVCDEYVFVMGTEFTPGLKPLVERAATALPVSPGIIGSDLLLFDRSDYGPFRKRKVPYLFFSTGESPVYHTPKDVPETLDYPKLTAISTLIQKIVEETASTKDLPRWAERAEHTVGEAVVVRDVLRRLLDHGEQLSIKPSQAGWLKKQIEELDAAIKRGSLTPTERRRMVLNAQFVLYSVL